jgi:DNA-binding XRE family transcriptional regulator
LARQLRLLRERSSLTQDEAAVQLDFSASKLGRIENGQQDIDVHWVRSMLDLYNAPEDWSRLISLARLARQRGWWRGYGLDDRGYVPLEASATLVREFNVTVVPGLLQTAEYAWALFGSKLVGSSTQERERDVEVRMVRQRRLHSEDDPLQFVTILDESVLHRPVGGLEVLHHQLAHLVIATELDTVCLQVLPTQAGAHPGLDGTFYLLNFGDLGAPDLAYVEHVAGSVHLEKDEEVSRCNLAFERLRSAALSPSDSVELIERLLAAR